MCPYSRAIKGNVPVKLTIGMFSLSISAMRQMDQRERKKLIRFEWFGSNSLEKSDFGTRDSMKCLISNRAKKSIQCLVEMQSIRCPVDATVSSRAGVDWNFRSTSRGTPESETSGSRNKRTIESSQRDSLIVGTTKITTDSSDHSTQNLGDEERERTVQECNATPGKTQYVIRDTRRSSGAALQEGFEQRMKNEEWVARGKKREGAKSLGICII